MLEVLTYYEGNKLAYTEAAGKALNALCLPAYRLQLAKGHWKLTSEKSVSSLCVALMEDVVLLHRAAAKPAVMSQTIPAMTDEEFKAAQLFLRFADYCEGRKLDIGRAVLLVHQRNIGS